MATTVVAATYGVLPEFDPDRDSVKSYTARAKVFFKANSIVEEKQAPIFLSCIGARTYDLLESLLAPTTLDEATFETLVKTLEEHFQPKPNSISKRYALSQRAQQPTETIAQYLAALRKLAIDCDFASKELLEEALRDRLVSGVCSAALRKKLLTMKDLTFAEACETAKSMEAAEADAKAIASISTAAVPATVQLVSKHQRWRGRQSSSHSPPQDKQQPCYRCGRRNHLPHQCKFRDAICHACGKRGHIAPACRSKQRQPQGPPPLKRGQAGTKANYVGVEADPAEEELHLFTLERAWLKESEANSLSTHSGWNTSVDGT